LDESYAAARGHSRKALRHSGKKRSHGEAPTAEGFQILDARSAGTVRAESGAAEELKGIGAQVGELGPWCRRSKARADRGGDQSQGPPPPLI
jgi:hypothetical protein